MHISLLNGFWTGFQILLNLKNSSAHDGTRTHTDFSSRS